MTYKELLKLPDWQKKRLEILDRDKWTCQICKETGRPLHVHHKWYESKRMPWDYPGEVYLTLCDLCHDGGVTGEDKKQLLYDINQILEKLSDLELQEISINLYGKYVYPIEVYDGSK
jgi:hypothetical protein